VRQNPTSLTKAIQIVLQMEQKWMQIKLAKAKIQELAEMEYHELQHSQEMKPHIIRQVNQRRAKKRYQPLKPSQKVFTEQKKKQNHYRNT
jgi:hypothetical protein